MSDSTDAQTGKNYAIMRVERIRELGEMRRVEQHNTREKLSENVEPGGPVPRELLPDGPRDLLDRAHQRMADLGLDLGKVEGAVGVEVVLTTSHNWWTIADEQMKQDWAAANLAWLDAKFGRALLSAKLHEDEKTPHIHAVALAAVCKVDGVRGPKPKTDEGWARRRAEEEKRKARWRWNYRDLFGKDFDQLSLEQDRYHAAVAHLGLHRGERGQDITDVTLDNGVVVGSDRLSRGKRRDGTDRPRRRITTKQYQALARDDRAKAAEARREAEQDRAGTQAARAIVAAERQAAAAVRNDAVIDAQRAAEDRRAAAAERARAELLRREQEASAVLQREELADLRASAAADRRAAERHRADLAAASAAAIIARDRAAADAAAAERQRRDAEAVYAAAVDERNAAMTARTALEDRRKLHTAQIALLARAVGDDTGMDLRPKGETFALGPGGLNDDDRALIARKWSPALISIGRMLAEAIERVRDRVRIVVLRERAVEDRDAAVTKRAAEAQAREAQLVQDQAAHARRIAAHQSAVMALDKQRAVVDADEARAADAAKAAATLLASAHRTQADADAMLTVQHRWMQAMDALAPHPDWMQIAPDGGLQLDRAIATVSPTLAATLKTTPPDWAVALAVERIELAEALRRAADLERAASYAAERLTTMIKQAGPTLTPAQQDIATKAQDVVKRFGPRPEDRER